MDSASTVFLASWVALHVGALMAAWVTRVASGRRFEILLHVAFFMAMAGVGAAALAAHVLELELWALSVATLVIMMLTAIVDFRRTHEPSHSLHPISSR